MSKDKILPIEGLVRLKTVLEVLPISRSTWYKGVKRGIYPKSKQIGERAKGYNVEEIRSLLT